MYRRIYDCPEGLKNAEIAAKYKYISGMWSKGVVFNWRRRPYGRPSGWASAGLMIDSEDVNRLAMLVCGKCPISLEVTMSCS